MLRVFKYQVMVDDYFEVKLPKGAVVLTVDLQREDVCMWALVDQDMPIETRRFRFTGTGHPIEEKLETLKFINTFQTGTLVFHIFEVIK